LNKDFPSATYQTNDRASNEDALDRLLDAILGLSKINDSAQSEQAIYTGIHELVRQFISADNFFVALLNADKNRLDFPYCIDESDCRFAFESRPYSINSKQRGYTEFILESGRSHLFNKHDATENYFLGKEPQTAIGIPLSDKDGTYGVITVQSYDKNIRYVERDKKLMSFLAGQIVTGHRRIADADSILASQDKLQEINQQLEQKVADRTRELLRSNERLKKNAIATERSKKYQQALYDIANITVSVGTMAELYQELHRIIRGLMYAENLFIALIDEDKNTVTIPYCVDEIEDNVSQLMATVPMAEFLPRLTGYVLRTGEPLFASGKEIAEMQNQGLLHVIGEMGEEWMGVPLKIQEEMLGVLVLQIYSREHRYSDADKHLITYVSKQIATSLARKRAEQQISEAKQELERRVKIRTKELSTSNQDLQQQINERNKAENLQRLPLLAI